MASATNKMLAAALDYASVGWRVFPILEVKMGPNGGCSCENSDCDKPGKHPAIKGWPKEATTNKKQIERWWTENPERGIGIATGEESNLTVLDVDGAEGVETLGKLSAGVGVPPTPCVKTGKGSDHYHYYFNYNKDVKSNSNKIGPKLDARGNGGYVVAPPSLHASGTRYTWLQHPSKVPMADWPDFLSGKGPTIGKRGRPQKETFNPANPQDVDKLKEALSYVDPDDEERWGQVGWIMGRAYKQSDVGYQLYQAWAARSRKYDAKRTKLHYYERSREIRGSEVKTTASIYAWAQEDGWAPTDDDEREEREFNIFENPYREESMVEEFVIAAAHAPAIFVMDKRLVRIVHYGSSGVADALIERDPTAFVIWEHDPDTIAVELGNVAAFWSKNAKGYKRSGFNRGAVRTFVAYRKYQYGDISIKPLDAFLPHPTLRADGTLITEVGYDAASRLFLTAAMPNLKVEKLTQEGAKAAMRKLREPFNEYPWADAIDRAVFVAALFTVGLRHLFDVAPLFAFSSPKHGSGKTQLAECLSRLWYGITLSKATWTPNPEEMEKRIAAFLLAGDRMVCLDNVTEGMRLEDSTLNKVLTSRRNTFRLLGKTERVELTNEATWFATGNQLLLSGDISRRALISYIDARVVDPGSRKFSIANLPAYIMEHRTELIGLALSIASSWMAAGKPIAKKKREFGSFTDWYDIIRPILLWAGEADIEMNLDTVSDEDNESVALEIFANAVRFALPPDGSRLTSVEILRMFGKVEGLRPAFTGCMFGNDRDPNLHSLGLLLRRCENKVFLSDNPGEPFTLTKKKDAGQNVYRWGVEAR